MTQSLRGTVVTLVPMTIADTQEFYLLATNTEGSRDWYGEQPPTQDAFFADWNDHYFATDTPLLGHCFWIVVDGQKIGQVNYNDVDAAQKQTELDIIIGSKKHMGKGYGSDAVRTLVQYLFQFPEIDSVWIAARADNVRAQHAYTKAGFVQEKYLPEEQLFNGKRVSFIKYRLFKTEFS